MKTKLLVPIFLMSFSCLSNAEPPAAPTKTTPLTNNPVAPTTNPSDTNVLPNCSKQNVKQQDGNVVLEGEKGQKPRLYFLHNTSKYIITVDHL